MVVTLRKLAELAMGLGDSVGQFLLRTAAGWLATPDDLYTLTIALNVESDPPLLTFALEINPELRAASKRSIKTWTFPTSTFGIPNQLGPRQQGLGPLPALPSDFVKELASYLAAGKATPLWISFGPVAGYLRLVAWDDLLRSALDRPILRLIDLESPPPRELEATLDIVLCASEPRAKSEFSEADVLPMIVRSILAANARQAVHIHVFADSAKYQMLSERLKDLGDRVRLYEPPDPERREAGDNASRHALPPTISNAWLRWIAQSLERPADIVHFVCHGYLTSEQGWLALAETPTRNSDMEWSRFICSADLDPFLVQVGAWSMVFSSPPGNFSTDGLRLLTNQICEDGCRSALLHDLAADMDGAQLTRAYKFLYHPGPDFAPNDPALSIYCHPSLVKVGTLANALVRGVAAALPSQFGFTLPEDITASAASGIDDALRKFQEQGGVPSWLATTQRYVEQRKLELRRLERQAGSDTDEQHHQIEQAKAMLSAIEQAVVGLANRPGGR